MKNLLTLITLALTMLAAAAAEPYCDARLFDEDDGLSQRSVKQVAVDADGMVWIATWNGLNRFDGYDFEVIRPQVGNSVRRYSSRFRDIRMACDGRMWCRIDDQIVRFDPRTLQFEDIHKALEERLDRRLKLRSWRMSADSMVMVANFGDIYVALYPEETVETGIIYDKEPEMDYLSAANRRIGDLGPYPYRDQAYGAESPSGIWVVTRQGVVAWAPDRATAPRQMADLGVGDGSLQFAATDRQGGLWFRSSHGAHRLQPGLLPFDRLPSDYRGRVIASDVDRSGRLWVAETDRKGLAAYDISDLGAAPLYIDGRGMTRRQFVPFKDDAVYSLTADNALGLLAGCKPKGLWQINDDGAVAFEGDFTNVYDIARWHGQTYVASMGGGVAGLSGQPEESMSTRRLHVMGDSVMLAATTGGLLAIDLRDPAKMTLHVTEPDRPASLDCVAVTDILVNGEGRIFVSTESSGVLELTGNPLSADAEFVHVNDPRTPGMSVVSALAPRGDRILAVSQGHIFTLDPDSPAGDPHIYGPAVWHAPLRFTEMRPLLLPDGRYLLGTADGGIIVDPDLLESQSTEAPAATFTKVSIGGLRDSLLTPAATRLVLAPHERSLTLHFAAPEYAHPEAVTYHVTLGDMTWTGAPGERSLTLFDLPPGRLMITVSATDPTGRFDGAPATLEIEVTPRFSETLMAKILLAVAVALVIGIIIRVVVYIRAIKRKQHETLAAYLRLMEQLSAPVPEPAADDHPAVSDDDKEFMDKVMAYVSEHLADTEADVDTMAAAVGMSRSSLTRRMRSLMGVTPADFIRRTRLERAATLLRTTTLSVKEIAWECGFTDLNYFGKSFKHLHSTTPTAYRKGE